MGEPAKGDSVPNPDPSSGNPDPAKPADKNGDVVAYETHRKLLGEKKRFGEENAELKARLAEIEKDKADAEEAKLKETNEYKQLYDNSQTKLKETETRLVDIRDDVNRAVKLRSVLQLQGMAAQLQLLGLLCAHPTSGRLGSHRFLGCPRPGTSPSYRSHPG